MEHYTKTTKADPKPLNLNKLVKKYLFVTKTKRNLFDVFLWWERKRIAFNIFVLTLCYISFEIQNLATNTFYSSAEIFTKRELIIFIVFYNIIYSCFCVFEFINKKSRKYGPNVFKNSLFICTSIVTIPTVFQVIETFIFY
tara:strand:- start:4581 stop:5003 length:423 start_codon:yes stop_codon:yes gene_type:complete